MPAQPNEISAVTLALVSHTNVGKTTLARTLLRRDVGEVLDQAHVTEQAEVFTVLEAGGTALRLADTPGFGDSARLLRRLRASEKPLLWFFQQRWDRVVDRPFWSSQQAALAVREHADVVLYLVNATEEPDEAGYVELELELLDWLEVPVVLLLNQTGSQESRRPSPADALANKWRQHAERFAMVKATLELDAFCRCWVEEGALWRQVTEVLPAEKAELMRGLHSAWEQRHLETFERSIELLADYLASTAVDREPLAERRPSLELKEQAMEQLGRRLVSRSEDLMTGLLALHGLEGEVAAEIDRQLDAYAVSGEQALDTERSALWGSVLSGALGGLAADVMAGGLTFGGGVVAGAILGALGGAGLARGFQLVQGEKLPEVGWSVVFLERLAAQALLRYLAVAHFGRGRGEFAHEEASRYWQDTVADVLRLGRVTWREALEQLAAGRQGRSPSRARARKGLLPLFDEAARAVLADGYPEAEELLRRADLFPETTAGKTAAVDTAADDTAAGEPASAAPGPGSASS